MTELPEVVEYYKELQLEAAVKSCWNHPKMECKISFGLIRN